MSAFKVKAGNGGDGDFELIEADGYPAVLIALIDLGTQNEQFQGTWSKKRKVFLAWEIQGTKKGNGEPFVMGEAYTLSLNEKAKLAKLIGKWRGKQIQVGEEFDVSTLLGQPCLLTVSHEAGKKDASKTYARIADVTQLPKPMKAAITKTHHKPFQWAIDDDTPAPAQEWLPRIYGETVADVIGKCDECVAAGPGAGNGGQGRQTAGVGAGGSVHQVDDDVAF